MVSDRGLCGTCVHRVEVRNTRGSVFSLCGRSRSDPSYPRYPRLPVLECEGYERVLAGDGVGGVEDANRGA
jgi:hypothetical protein